MLCKYCNEYILDDSKICKKYKNHCLCKKCKGKQDKKYRLENKEKVSKYFYDKWRNDANRRIKNKLHKEVQRFGFDATKFVSNKRCKDCNLDNPSHIKKYNCRLNIHHNDNNGRKNLRLSKKTINDNLVVLCQSCHTKRENLMRDYKKEKENRMIRNKHTEKDPVRTDGKKWSEIR